MESPLRPSTFGVAAFLLAVMLAGCADGEPSAAPNSTGTTSSTSDLDENGTDGGDDVPEEMRVHLVDDRFEDGDRTVVSGQAIRYMNVGESAHTVTIHLASDPPETRRLDQSLEPGEEVVHEFGEAGTYHVWCRFHGTMTSGMASVITVE